MPFVQAPINYAAQYGRELANAYPYLSYYADLWNQGESQRFRPLRGKTVYIPSLTTSGARAANRDQITGVFNRNANIDWQACDMAMDREWDTLVDPMDMAETNEVLTIGNVTATFNRFQKVPEMDAYMSSKLAGFAGAFGGVSTTVLTAANILDEWDTALAYMTNNRVNRDRVRCKITPAAYKLLKEAAGITRFVSADSGIRNVDRNVGRLDGVLIEEVPSDMMQTIYDFTTGWAVNASAAQINFLLYDPMAIAAPVVYEVAMMSPPTAQSKGKYLYYERYYYDVFCLINRGAGVYANLSAAPSASVLTINSVAGSAAGASIVSVTGETIGLAGGVAANLLMKYSVSQSAATLTYGSDLPAGTWIEATGSPIAVTGASAGDYITVALINRSTEHVVAGGNAALVIGT